MNFTKTRLFACVAACFGSAAAAQRLQDYPFYKQTEAEVPRHTPMTEGSETMLNFGPQSGGRAPCSPAGSISVSNDTTLRHRNPLPRDGPGLHSRTGDGS